jgi:hypothetical protein
MDKELIGRKCLIKNSGSNKAWTIAGFNKNGDAYLEYEGVVTNGLPFNLNKLEIFPITVNRESPQYGVGLDPMRVTHDEATELLAHMLGLAHMYFQATPDDARGEVERIIAQREGDSPDGAVMVGAMAAFDAWHAHYEKLRLEDEE